MDLINEKNNQLMLQNAYSISKLPDLISLDWPNLFDDIISSLEKYVFVENNLVATNNMLIILNRIIKTLSTVKIGRARHAMQAKQQSLSMSWSNCTQSSLQCGHQIWISL